MKTVIFKYCTILLLVFSLCACSSCFKPTAPQKAITIVVPYTTFDVLYRVVLFADNTHKVVDISIRNKTNTDLIVEILRDKRTFKTNSNPILIDSMILGKNVRKITCLQDINYRVYFKTLQKGTIITYEQKKVEIPTYEGE